MSKLDFCIVIPVFNEEKIIQNIINKALKFSDKYKFKIVIINDGSTDLTKKILSKIRNKKIIIFHKKNEGHGKTILKGYKMAIKLKPEFVLQADSGDKISFNEFKKLFKFKSEFDYVEGNRKNRDDPLYRIFISFGLKIMFASIIGGAMNYIPGETENSQNIIETCLICIFSSAVMGLIRQFSDKGEYSAMGLGILAVVVVINSISNNFKFGKRIMLLLVAVIGMLIGSGFIIQACLLGTLVYLILRNSEYLMDYIYKKPEEIGDSNT